MQHSIFKPIIIGILVGGIMFVASFVLIRVLFFALIAAAIYKIFARRRMGGGFGYGFAERVRSMSEEEFEQFKNRRQYGWGGHHRYSHFEQREEQEVRPINID